MRTAALALAVAAAACGPETAPAPTTPSGPTDFANEMLSAHNAVRAAPSPAPSPPLPPLGWSAAVAGEAQSWAGGCTYAHDPQLASKSLGQNIAATAPAGFYSASQVVDLWASEAQYYAYASNTCAASQQCGHYTQIVWRWTVALGCAHVVCPAAQSPFGGATPTDWDYWVCDYAPPGNVVGLRPY